MSLNITAERRVDISDYGIGWTDCYLLVRSMNPAQLKEWSDMINSPQAADMTLDRAYGDLLKRQMIGGVVMQTLDDGSKEKHNIDPSEIADVVDQIDIAHKQQALFVAAGNVGLKGL